LIKNPYGIVSNLLSSLLNVSIDSGCIEERYKNNLYRRFRSKKISSWSINTYGKIRNANNRKIKPEDIDIFRVFLNARVNERYAEHFGMSSIGFREAMNLFGYSEPQTNEDMLNKPRSYKNFYDTKKLAIKFFLDFVNRDTSIDFLRYYLNPLVFE